MEGNQEKEQEQEQQEIQATETQGEVRFFLEGEETSEVNTQTESTVVESDVNSHSELDSQIDNLSDTDNDDGNDDEYVELDENLALQFLADSKGITVDEFRDSLTPKQQKEFAPEIVAFNEFYEKTGNKNYNDFLETQKDWSTENTETTLREYIRLSNPDLSKKEQDFLYNEKYNTQDLDEEDDENLITKKGIDAKTDLRKANEFFNKRKEEFSVTSGTDAYIPIEYREAKSIIENQKQNEQEYERAFQENRNDYLAKNKAIYNSNYNGVKVNLGADNGNLEISLKPSSSIEDMERITSDSNNIFGKYMTKDGSKLENHVGYNKALIYAEYGDELIKMAYNRGKADKVEADDKISKNIQVDNVSNPVSTNNSGIKFFVE